MKRFSRLKAEEGWLLTHDNAHFDRIFCTKERKHPEQTWQITRVCDKIVHKKWTVFAGLEFTDDMRSVAERRRALEFILNLTAELCENVVCSVFKKQVISRRLCELDRSNLHANEEHVTQRGNHLLVLIRGTCLQSAAQILRPWWVNSWALFSWTKNPKFEEALFSVKIASFCCQMRPRGQSLNAATKNRAASDLEKQLLL